MSQFFRYDVKFNPHSTIVEKNNLFIIQKKDTNTMAKTVTLSKQEFTRLKQRADVNSKFLKELAESLADIKAGRVKQIR